MSEPGNTTTQLQRLVERLRAGDDQARADLISRAEDRLRRLARRLLAGFARLRRWEETDDVLQGALLRLHKALAAVQPESVRDFLGLAALQLRRELLTLTEHHYGPHQHGARHSSVAGLDGIPADRSDYSTEPSSVAVWHEVLERAATLPAEEQEVFNLLFYKGLSQAEVAEVLGITVRTVKRRWRSARLLLHEALTGERPGESP
jgi:RNA polymerase sigma-70 factor (ECF subfamily)